MSLAILAGGKGLRLGGLAKGLLRFEGQTLLERLLVLRPEFQETFLLTSDPAPYAAFGIPMYEDAWPERGAPGGLCTALLRARTPWVLAIGCDMPFVQKASIALLLTARERSEVVAFDVGGKLQPFPALYRTALVQEWGPRLQNHPSLRSLMESATCTRIPEEVWAREDGEGRSWLSINTPENLKAHRIELPSESLGLQSQEGGVAPASRLLELPLSESDPISRRRTQ